MGREMRIALELQPCCGSRSGIGTYAWELAKRLEDGDGLRFFGNLFNFMGRNDNTQALAGISMPVHESRIFPYGIYRRIWNFIPMAYDRLFPEKADLSVFFNYIVPPHIDGKVMTTIHDMTYLRFPETMDRRNLRRLERDMAYSVERSDRLLTISEFSKKEIVELLGVSAAEVSVVPCAPSIGDAPADFNGCAVKYGIRQPYLLYVGTIEPRKNLLRLLKAFQILKKEQGIPHQLVLAGGNGWANREIYQLGERIKDVLFTGYITQGEKYALYRSAAAFVFPSMYEGFGIPPLEAMWFGCPVVCSNAASLPETVGEAAEMVDPFREEDIARGLWAVLSNEEYAAELVRRGEARCKRTTWTASAAKLREICWQVLGEREIGV